MRMPMLWKRLGTPRRAGRNVDPGLDGHHHAGLEHAPFVADLVVADVVHVEPKPMAGAMHEEAPVGAVAIEFRGAALQQPELHQPLGDDMHRRLVRLVPMIARAHAGDRGAVRLQHHLVYRALLAA